MSQSNISRMVLVVGNATTNFPADNEFCTFVTKVGYLQPYADVMPELHMRIVADRFEDYLCVLEYRDNKLIRSWSPSFALDYFEDEDRDEEVGPKTKKEGRAYRDPRAHIQYWLRLELDRAFGTGRKRHESVPHSFIEDYMDENPCAGVDEAIADIKRLTGTKCHYQSLYRFVYTRWAARQDG